MTLALPFFAIYEKDDPIDAGSFRISHLCKTDSGSACLQPRFDVLFLAFATSLKSIRIRNLGILGTSKYSLTSGILDEKGIYGRSTGVGLALSPPGTAVLAVSGPIPA